jgi:hypothetical protein
VEQWHYTHKGKQEGPISFDELLARAGAGKIESTDMIWTARIGNWVQAGSIPGPCRGQPPPLPPLAASVTGRVIVKGQLWGSALWFKISFDHAVLGEARLWKGCDFPFRTTPGEHLLEVVYGGALMTLGQKTKTYPLMLRESGDYHITLKLTSTLGGLRFVETAEVHKMPG